MSPISRSPADRVQISDGDAMIVRGYYGTVRCRSPSTMGRPGKCRIVLGVYSTRAGSI